MKTGAGAWDTPAASSNFGWAGLIVPKIGRAVKCKVKYIIFDIISEMLQVNGWLYLAFGSLNSFEDVSLMSKYHPRCVWRRHRLCDEGQEKFKKMSDPQHDMLTGS